MAALFARDRGAVGGVPVWITISLEYAPYPA